MPRKIGLMQTGGIGDIIIALPIADHFLERGFEIVWPIAESYVESFRAVKPEIQFFPVPDVEEKHVPIPASIMQQQGCEAVYCLYISMPAHDVCDKELARYMKFDEYKYAITRVPFGRKWDLRLKRNAARERELYERLNITRPYICVHDEGSSMSANVLVPPAWKEEFQIVKVTALTSSPFDWIYTFENAAKLLMIDSCFSNLIEQLNLPNEKYLVLRSPGPLTPVFKNHWQRLVPEKNAAGAITLRQA